VKGWGRFLEIRFACFDPKVAAESGATDKEVRCDY
jgi:hypothetical protein